MITEDEIISVRGKIEKWYIKNDTVITNAEIKSISTVKRIRIRYLVSLHIA